MDLQLHIFVDASEEACAYVAYFRAEFVDGIEVALIGGKAKEVPKTGAYGGGDRGSPTENYP